MTVPRERMRSVLRAALAESWLDDEHPAVLFFDLDLLAEARRERDLAFPDALPTVAVKAMPLPSVLRRCVAGGDGLEVASPGEMAIARSLDVDPSRVAFDSPAKTRREIVDALAWGCSFSVDSLQELARVDQAIGERQGGVALRVNPDLEGSSVPATFTAAAGSKFGVSLGSERERILAAYAERPWLDGLHVHVGSQGCSIDLLVAGVRAVAALADEIAARGRPLRWLDFGGGLPIAYRAGERAPSFADYADLLREEAPGLFRPGLRLVTEFGRAVFAPCGWFASRVETTREQPRRVATVHVGADAFVRTAYAPADWHHELAVFDGSGEPKAEAEPEPWDVAGPLCFSGDLIARSRPLPEMRPGDLVTVRDAGAYTLSMWSRYNSRLCPAVVGYSGEPPALTVLKPQETPAALLRFWTG